MWKIKRFLSWPWRQLRGRLNPRKGSYPEFDALMQKVKETGQGMLIGWDVGNYAYQVEDGVQRKTVKHQGKCPITSHHGVNYTDHYKSAMPSAIS